MRKLSDEASVPTKAMIVAPAFNEAKMLPAFIGEISDIRKKLQSETELRLLIVNDGSRDGTLEVLRDFAGRNPDWFSFVSFSSNFGHQAALTAGLLQVDSWPDVVITMDSDLEHPPEMIPKLVRAWVSERPVLVNTIRAESKELGFLKRFFSGLFYRTTARLTKLAMTPGQADYRLWDASVLRAVQSKLFHIGSLRVFAAWLPGKKIFLEYAQNVQSGRKSRFTFRKNLEFWKVGIVRFSDLPLRSITVLGATGVTLSLLYAAYILVQFFSAKTVPGWSSLILTVIFMSCIQLFSLGVVASYLRRLVFAKDLPPFIIQEQSFFKGKSAPGPGIPAEGLPIDRY